MKIKQCGFKIDTVKGNVIQEGEQIFKTWEQAKTYADSQKISYVIVEIYCPDYELKEYKS